MQFTGKKLLILMRLLLSDHKKSKTSTTLAKLAQELGYLSTGPDVRELFKFLIDTGCLVESGKTWNNATLYYVHDDHLCTIIREQEVYKLAIACFKYTIP